MRRAKRKGPGRRLESELGHGTCVGARPEPLLDAVFGRAWGMAVASKVHGSRDPGGCRGTTGLVAASCAGGICRVAPRTLIEKANLAGIGALRGAA